MIGTSELAAFKDWASRWADLVAEGWLESLVLFAVAVLVWISLRRWAPSQLGYGLFLLVLLKIALPLSIVLPPEWAAWFPGYHVDQAMESLAADEPEANGAVVVSSAGPAPEAAVPPPVEPLQESALAMLVPWLFGSWLVVVIALLLRFVVVQRQTTRIVRRARRMGQGELAVDPGQLLDAMGLRRTRVRFLVSEEVASPAAGGLLRPFVLVPDGLMQQLSAPQCRWVLLHELAHIRRGDLWVSLFQRLLQIAFFFHPLVWVVNRLVNEQREFACDEAAVAASGGRRKSCGEGFLSVVEWAQGQSELAHGTLGMVSSKQLIRRRLMRILDGRRRGGAKSKVLCLLATLAIGAVFVPSVRAQQGQKSDEDLRLEILQERLKKWESEVRIMRLELERLRRDRGSEAAPRSAGSELRFWNSSKKPRKVNEWTGFPGAGTPAPSPVDGKNPVMWGTPVPGTPVDAPKDRVFWSVPSGVGAGSGGASVQEWTENVPQPKKREGVYWPHPNAKGSNSVYRWVEKTAPDVDLIEVTEEPAAPPKPRQAPKGRPKYVRVKGTEARPRGFFPVQGPSSGSGGGGAGRAPATRGVYDSRQSPPTRGRRGQASGRGSQRPTSGGRRVKAPTSAFGQSSGVGVGIGAGRPTRIGGAPGAGSASGAGVAPRASGVRGGPGAGSAPKASRASGFGGASGAGKGGPSRNWNTAIGLSGGAGGRFVPAPPKPPKAKKDPRSGVR